jgi:hypothetical protein
MVDSPVTWPDDIDEVLTGDLTAAASYLTPAGGAVVTAVAPCGLDRRAEGAVGFTTSLGFGKKLEHIIRRPRVALAYHAREHGSTSSPKFVLVQGDARVDLAPSRERLESFMPQAERYLGEVKRGVVWDRVLHDYYWSRVFVDISARRVVAWGDLLAGGEPEVFGSPLPEPPRSQPSPKGGTAPRVDLDRLVASLVSLPHRVISFRGSDGYPVVLPIELAGHDPRGLGVVTPAGLLPAGGRRAGLLAHAYHPSLVGLGTRVLTGWLDVDQDEAAVFAPHTSQGFRAPPRKRVLLLVNGLLAKQGMRRARRQGLLGELERLSATGAEPVGASPPPGTASTIGDARVATHQNHDRV